MLRTLIDTDERKALGARMKTLRQAKNLTQKEVAAELGIKPNHYSKYEYGIHIPPLDKAAQLAALFSVSLDFLVLGTEEDQQALRHTGLIERMKRIQDFDRKEIETIAAVIDAMIAKHTMEKSLKPIPV